MPTVSEPAVISRRLTREERDAVRGEPRAAHGHAKRLLVELEAREHDLSNAVRLIRDLSRNPKEADERQTGRSTRLILRGMIAISEGRDVLVIAHSFAFGLDLVRKIRERCRSWHIPIDGGGTPKLTAQVPNDDRSGFSGVVLVDHKVAEDLEAIAAAFAAGHEVEL